MGRGSHLEGDEVVIPSSCSGPGAPPGLGVVRSHPDVWGTPAQKRTQCWENGYRHGGNSGHTHNSVCDSSKSENVSSPWPRDTVARQVPVTVTYSSKQPRGLGGQVCSNSPQPEARRGKDDAQHALLVGGGARMWTPVELAVELRGR